MNRQVLSWVKKNEKKKTYGVSLVHVVRDEHAVQYAKTCDS